MNPAYDYEIMITIISEHVIYALTVDELLLNLFEWRVNYLTVKELDNKNSLLGSQRVLIISEDRIFDY